MNFFSNHSLFKCIVVSVTAACFSTFADADGRQLPQSNRVAYQLATPSSLTMSSNKISDPGFEPDGATKAWRLPNATLSRAAHSGEFALEMTHENGGADGHAVQLVHLHQSVAKPLYISAFSKSQIESAAQPNGDYSVNLSFVFNDDSVEHGYTINFRPGQDEWHLSDQIYHPRRPIKSVWVHLLLRGKNYGRVWFDDVSLQEIETPTAEFDRATVILPTAVDATAPSEEDVATIACQQALSISFYKETGALQRAGFFGSQIGKPSLNARSGFFVRDQAAKGDWHLANGKIEQHADALTHTAELAAQSLKFSADYQCRGESISVTAKIEDLAGDDRAVTLYFALPAAGSDWWFHEDKRRRHALTGFTEKAAFSFYPAGAFAPISRYPWAVLSRGDQSLVISTPLDTMAMTRIVANPQTNQLYIAFDLGLSPDHRDAGSATVHFQIDALAVQSGEPFGTAVAHYLRQNPSFFPQSPKAKGNWVAFSDVSAVSGAVTDFGIGVHELAQHSYPGLVQKDEEMGIDSYLYLSLPHVQLLPIRTAGIDHSQYERVVRYVEDTANDPYASDSATAQAILSSGIHDEQGRFVYRTTSPPWCRAASGCVEFSVNPDPDIRIGTYINKAELDWRIKSAFADYPELDGGFFDAVMDTSSVLIDFRRAHFATADYPLSFMYDPIRIGIPSYFSRVEMIEFVRAELKAKEKSLMGNHVLRNGEYFAAHLFEYLGMEVVWTNGDHTIPDDDRVLSYRRALAGPRAYGLLMNDNYTKLDFKKYLETSLFYGFYPSAHSQKSGAQLNFWENPALYNAQRSLYSRVMPVIERLNAAGWAPVTAVKATNPAVHLERFGRGETFYLTVRNTTPLSQIVELALDRTYLDAGSPLILKSSYGQTWSTRLERDESVLELNLAPEEVLVLTVSPLL